MSRPNVVLDFLGTISKDEILSRDASISENATTAFYFQVIDEDGFFTEITINNLRDDLDLTLFRLNNESTLDIAESGYSGTEEEYIGKFLKPGLYKLNVDYFDALLDPAYSPFDLSIDTKSFYENTVLPNDPLFDKQWHLFNKGQGTGIDNEDILAPEAWKIRSTSPDVTVAVIDGAIDLTHEDLINNLWVNAGEIPDNNYDDDGNKLTDDYHGWNFANNAPLGDGDNHGTHVAGTIGAEGNNNIGVSGVTWDVNLMSLDVFGGEELGSDQAILNAIYYAVDNGADVLNLSLGATFPNKYYPSLTSVEEYIEIFPDIHNAYSDAFNYAVNNNVVVVLAAGNENANLDQGYFAAPAYFGERIAGVISVAAAANTGQRAAYTNYGSQISIAAPGGDIQSEMNLENGLFATAPTNPQEMWYEFGPLYGPMEGTSMAAPVVAGAVALMIGENPYLNPAQVESIMQDTAFEYRSLENIVKNGGYLNLEGALQAASVLADKTVVRLYDSSTGRHLISSNKDEIDILTGSSWKNEGAFYYSPEEATAEVFRFYVSDENRHFYTALESERDMIIGDKGTFLGWEYEGSAFSAYSTSDYTNGATAVVRYLSTENGSHVYSTSTSEQALLNASSDWINEGIAWYGDPMVATTDLV